jgi:3D (Asp-Asp-Asp) domain-containing protein
MSYNAWLYSLSNPVNYTDPSGRQPVPRPGLCSEPPASARNWAKLEIILDRNDKARVYCGEFKLTAYQFVDSEGDYTRIATTPLATANNVPYTVPATFAKDVDVNGTGYSLSSGCSGGYFHIVTTERYQDTRFPSRFDLFCGKGKPFDKDIDAYKVAAADPSVLNLGTPIYLPQLCGTRANCTGVYNPYLTVRDTGGAIQGYRLDIFAGQGPGERSTRPGDSPALRWIGVQATHLPNITTADGRPALGPASAYQIVPDYLQELFHYLYCNLLLENSWQPDPGGPR